MRTDSTAPAPTEPELIPLSAFLCRFSVSKSSFYRMAAQGEAPDVVKLGRATFVPVATAKAWMAARIRPAIELCRTGDTALPTISVRLGKPLPRSRQTARPPSKKKSPRKSPPVEVAT